METGKENAEKRQTVPTPESTTESSQTPGRVPDIVVKDFSLCNLIDKFSGKGSVTVTEYFHKIEMVAKSCNWTDADKVAVATLRLSGAAASFLSYNKEANSGDITFARLRDMFVERFKAKPPVDRFHCSDLQNVLRRRDETPQQFGDRCRQIVNDEAERVMLAVYLNGLSGPIAMEVRCRLPSTLSEAVQIATNLLEIDTLAARKNTRLM